MPDSLQQQKERARIIANSLKQLFPNARIALKFSNNWELLVAVMLSAQCTDKKVNEVTQKLFRKYRTLDDYIAAKPEEFQQDIYSTGFFRSKEKNILAAAKLIKEKFNGQVPRIMSELLSVSGVARKTANVVLGNAYGVVEGIAVDTHVKRLSFLLGLTKNTNSDRIEQDLMNIIPREEWFSFTYRLIDFGRTYCPARAHDHAQCLSLLNLN